ncbi:TIGR00266 family protein [Synergistaceae bacterium OttesenSCG-928-I11]|nr:TIGR00266 family protein [Synergistaceae bacterium OttesenSCG-928-I11]
MEYKIFGDSMPYAVCEMSSGEAVYTESGGMSWMTDTFEMSTNMEGGLLKGLFRSFSGESIFMTTYTAKSKGKIAFASGYPGEIRALHLAQGQSMICQKQAFMAAERSVQLDTFFQEKMSVGFFGGEGFIMQKLTGPGVAFVELDGSIAEYELGAGEKMIVDTGNLAMCEETVKISVQMVKGFKNILFGGEGLFLTSVTGPGKIWLQSMPFSNIADKILSLVPSKE